MAVAINDKENGSWGRLQRLVIGTNTVNGSVALPLPSGCGFALDGYHPFVQPLLNLKEVVIAGIRVLQ